MEGNNNYINFKNNFETRKKRFVDLERNEPFVFDEQGESNIWIKVTKKDEILTTNKPASLCGESYDNKRNIYNLTLGYLSCCEDESKSVQTVALDIIIG